MKRDVLITVLLVIAGIVVAFVLFCAGALWKCRVLPRRSSYGVTRAARVVAQDGFATSMLPD